MLPAWLDVDLCAVICLGVGGVLLGLHGLGGKDRRGTVLLSLLILAVMAWLAFRGEPAALWGPPTGLVGLVLLGRLSRFPHFARTILTLGNLARSRRVQASVFLLAGPALALGWIYRLELRLSPTVDMADSLELRPLQSVSTPAGQAVTDTGRLIPLLHKTLTAEEQTVLREREEQFTQRRALRLIRMAGPDETTNCHGWTFTDGAYWVPQDQVDHILHDNGYYPVSVPHEHDVVIYHDATGNISHSGMVRAAPQNGAVLVESKWGGLGRYIHRPEDTPYGDDYSFFRTARAQHLLSGLPGSGTPSAEIAATAAN